MDGPDWFVEGFGDAIADVRQTLVEEGWFGRAVTDGPAGEPASLEAAFDWVEAPIIEAPAIEVEDVAGMDIDLGPEL